MIAPVFNPIPKGVEVFADDRALLQGVQQWVRKRTPGLSDIRLHAAKYETRTPTGGKHLYQHRLFLAVQLDDALKSHLMSLGIQPASFQFQAQPSGAAQATPQVTVQQWDRHLSNWMDREMGRVNRHVGSWRIPHAELRQLIQQGFWDDASHIIQHLFQTNNDLAIDLYRYQLWLDRERQDWLTLIERYTPHKEKLGVGGFLAFVAEAHLEQIPRQGKQAAMEALEVLQPLISDDFVTPQSAPHFALAAKCAWVLEETELACIHLNRAWPALMEEDQEKHRSLHQTLMAVQSPGPMPPSRPSLAWEVLLETYALMLGSKPLTAFLELQSQVKGAVSPAPPAIVHLLARLAGAAGQTDEARSLHAELWASRESLEASLVDDVRAYLIRDAHNRENFEGIPQYLEDWQGISPDPDLLFILGETCDYLGDRIKAEYYHQACVEHGGEQPEALLFLARRACEKFQADPDLSHLHWAHRLFTRLVGLPEHNLTPQDVLNWVEVLLHKSMKVEALTVIDNVVRGLRLHEYPTWLAVFREQVNHLMRLNASPEQLARASIDHLLAAQGTVSDQELQDILKRPLERLKKQDRTVLTAYLEEAEGVEGVRQAIVSLVTDLTIDELDRGVMMDHGLIHQWIMLGFSCGGEDHYQFLNEAYQAALKAIREKGETVELPDHRHLLAGKTLCLVGGHGHWQKRAVEELTRMYGASDVRVVPASWDENNTTQDILPKVRGCDLVLVMWKTIKHDTTEILHNLQDKQSLSKAQVRQVAGTGGKSFVREALRHFQQQDQLKA